jgi:hypothetical protein
VDELPEQEHRQIDEGRNSVKEFVIRKQPEASKRPQNQLTPQIEQERHRCPLEPAPAPPIWFLGCIAHAVILAVCSPHLRKEN